MKSVKNKRIKKVSMPCRAKSRATRVVLFQSTIWKKSREVYFGKEQKEIATQEYTLPPSQKKVIDLVKDVAKRYDYTVKIIDEAKQNFVQRLTERIKRIDTIPTVRTRLGGTIKGPQITKKDIELLLSKEMQQLE